MCQVALWGDWWVYGCNQGRVSARLGVEQEGIEGLMRVKELIFYSVGASVIAVIAQVAGASIAVTLFSSLLIPPALLLAVRIIRR